MQFFKNDSDFLTISLCSVYERTEVRDNLEKSKKKLYFWHMCTRRHSVSSEKVPETQGLSSKTANQIKNNIRFPLGLLITLLKIKTKTTFI